MLGRSLPELVFIRVCIFLLQNTIPLAAVALGALVLLQHGLKNLPPWAAVLFGVTQGLVAALLVADGLFFLALYRPYRRSMQARARHPRPPTRAEREALFAKCVANMPRPEFYLRQWFLGAEMDDIREDNLREFLLWSFFDRDGGGDLDDETEEELAIYVRELEILLGRDVGRGRGPARSLRLTVDPVEPRFRSVLWFLIVALVDAATHLRLLWAGLRYHATPWGKRLSVFPPRPLSLLPAALTTASASAQLSYWYRPHTAKDKLPVVFVHGIGIGMYPYANFVAGVGKSRSGDGDSDDGIGIIALELLPISSRFVGAPLDREGFLSHVSGILAHHGWERFVLVSHSYGSVLTTHMIRSPALASKIDSVVLVDPVSLLLHLPDVAYNFTRRRPKTANEWQLWFFASTDPGTAHTLGRHFFWRENIVWKEELVWAPQDAVAEGEPDGAVGRRRRKVAVCLSGKDLIVDVDTVLRYLAIRGDFKDMNDGDFAEIIRMDMASVDPDPGRWSGQGVMRSGIEVQVGAELDHAQIFDGAEDSERLLKLVRRYCSTEDVG